MTKRDPAIQNLLLATAYLRNQNSSLALQARRAWLNVMLDEMIERRMPLPAAARDLFSMACQLCDAAGVDRATMVEDFHKSGELHTSAAELETKLDGLIEALLLFTTVRIEASAERLAEEEPA